MFIKRFFYKITNREKYLQYKVNTATKRKIEWYKSHFEEKVINIQKIIEKQKEISFLHSGHLGDVIDSLAVIQELSKAKSCLYLGRGSLYPLAMEGALKLKEISYIHAEGYPAGELKHGPLALLSSETPVIALAVQDHTYSKLITNIEEISARSAPVISVVQKGDNNAVKVSDYHFELPEIDPVLSPFPVAVFLQLLSYYIAHELGTEIDKPRNLAKSVTVE